MTLKINRNFKHDYDQIFKTDPEAANLYLLLCELADNTGQVQIDPEELLKLMADRFEDPAEYAL